MLPLSGGEDAEFFSLEEESYLVTAGVRAGHGPYRYNTTRSSTSGQAAHGHPSRRSRPSLRSSGISFGSAAEHSWRWRKASHSIISRRRILGPRESMNGTACNLPIFKLLKACGDTTGNRSKSPGQSFLAYADHVGESVLLAWNGSSFTPLQSFSEKGGRCFRYFTADGEHYLAFANIQGDSTLYRWGREGVFSCQRLSGPGG